MQALPAPSLALPAFSPFFRRDSEKSQLAVPAELFEGGNAQKRTAAPSVTIHRGFIHRKHFDFHRAHLAAFCFGSCSGCQVAASLVSACTSSKMHMEGIMLLVTDTPPKQVQPFQLRPQSSAPIVDPTMLFPQTRSCCEDIGLVSSTIRLYLACQYLSRSRHTAALEIPFAMVQPCCNCDQL